MICSALHHQAEIIPRIFSPDYKGVMIYIFKSGIRFLTLFFFGTDFRMYEKLHHPQNSHSISSVVSTSSKSLLEPMAKDLLDNADENAVNSDLEIMDLESYMTAADEETLRRPESSLPSIEELTKNVQNLIDKDNAEVTEEVDKLTLQEIKEEKVKAADTKSESFEEKIQEVEKCQEEHELLDVKEKEEDEGQKQEDVNTNDDDNKSDEKSSQVEIPEDQNNRDEKVKFDSSKQGLSESKSRNTLSKLQDEIDKLLAPLTPNAVTPKEELVEVALKEVEDDDDDRMSISSTVSSSPFELCEITEAAIIEHNGHHSSITPVNEDKVEVVDKKSDDNENKAKTSKSDAWIAVTDNNADQINDVSSKSDNKKVVEVKDILKTPTEQETFKKEDKPKEQKVNNISVRPKLKIGISLAKDDLIEVLDTEEIKEPSPKPSKVIPKSESPVSPEEAQALLKIVDDYDRKSLEPVPNVDNYMLASSRLMLKRQLRQNVVDKNLFSTAAAEVLGTRSNRVKEALSSRTNHYSSDSYDYRPPYVVPSSMTSSYSAGDDYTSSRYSTRPSSYHFSSSYNSTPSASGYSSNSDRNQAISDAVGQIRSMGFTDEDGWLTQLCTIKRGNVADILDVLLPVKR